jgi:excisionase family DNA binding protein
VPRSIDDDLMTVMKIASTLKLTPQTIGNCMQDGELPYVRVGTRRMRVWRSDLRTMVGAASPGNPQPKEAPTSIWNGHPLPVTAKDG